MTNTTILRGPGGITLTLDPNEVFPDDPGAGCPALVQLKGGRASYTCAVNEGIVMGRQGDITLSPAQMAWLEKQADAVGDVESGY